jgi:hypothetical protein
MTDPIAVVSVVSSAAVGMTGVFATIRVARMAARQAHKQDKRERYIEFETSLSQIMTLALPPRGNPVREQELVRAMVLAQAQLVALPLTGAPGGVSQAGATAAMTANLLARVPPSATVEEAHKAFVALVLAMRDDMTPGWRSRWRHPSRWLRPHPAPGPIVPLPRSAGDVQDPQPTTAAPREQ